ncbi:hypothetical protein M2137_001464 [Parabacteroides sp. PFB2-10]|uniref:DUF4834 family protein n=1 Tax=Parabacteroides sp. PFB2-10 TaxID=1742405 RepID=UPI002475BDFC|nr:DUF4834 family protein [Parabacteroides sp. PFB2-10]MDH6312689.1 hypothetical protein [Parabacteroides sp. PFB2-10]MDL2244043.1 DUF4834 family protein [Parabacteroides sp. OttesenSCG-928-J18]
MFRFLIICVFFFVILMFLMGFSVFKTLREIFFGSSGKRAASNQRSRPSSQSAQQPRQEEQPPQRKKIFAKDEGEYVDYEEVKE